MCAVFSFKYFSINQNLAFKIGTDSLLLGAWCKTTIMGFGLDIGAGTGVLSIMIAQKSKLLIDSVEIDSNCIEETNQNVLNSVFSNRINVFHANICSYNPKKRYDLIVCNPPYFQNSTQSKKYNTARHQIDLNFNTLAHHGARLLKQDGNMSIVVPFHQAQNVLINFGNHGLFAQNICSVQHHKNSDCSIQLIQFKKQSNGCNYQKLVLYESENIKTHDFKKLCSTFVQD